LIAYETEVLSLNIEGLSIDIERVTNIDALYDELVSKGKDHEDFKDERIPYWAELWASALALSQYLVTSKLDFQGKKVLEIGAGLGLPSIVAAKLGAAVCVTDYLPEAVDFSRQNFQRNNLSNAKFEVLDWRNPNENFAAEIVLAADVAYENRMFDYLPIAFKTLCKPDGTIFLSEPNRGLAQFFLKDLHNKGFQVEKIIIPTTLFGVQYNINVLKIKVLSDL
jgi:predicted nicotinamide N-methyase